MRMLYVGPMKRGSTTEQRYKALLELGYNIDIVNTANDEQLFREKLLKNRLKRYCFRHAPTFVANYLDGPVDLSTINTSILECIKKNRYHLVWLDKALTVNNKTLLDIKKTSTKIIGYSPDDMYSRHNQSANFLKHIKNYDHFLTTKSYGVDELKSLGCVDTRFVGNAYDKNTHFPREKNQENSDRFGGDIGFIGDYEFERFRSLKYISKTLNERKVRIWGPNWEKAKGIHNLDNITCEFNRLIGSDYSTAISNFKINLCFLRKINRDLQTTRTIEIPACGGFMLAERTEEHRDLFIEGKEAEFFSSDEELVDKIKFYLDNDSARLSVAKSGFNKCIRAGYDNKSRLKKILVELGLYDT
ncbi:hypothetical protein BCS93_08860 [Vibrio breoganii]|uniref:Spore protein YkvP/CgeB glycosyl transferase-like domain-containing protein n=1 Tax=Vibrio breoganii TaxID=553239 RepID=A0AAP8SX70_9VIBR|nr:glycosyltransferase [Vibrio breoganii]PMP11312.1 hypothetical protein BCS93_08860 [Vibrio breoganii]